MALPKKLRVLFGSILLLATSLVFWLARMHVISGRWKGVVLSCVLLPLIGILVYLEYRYSDTSDTFADFRIMAAVRAFLDNRQKNS